MWHVSPISLYKATLVKRVLHNERGRGQIFAISGSACGHQMHISTHSSSVAFFSVCPLSRSLLTRLHCKETSLYQIERRSVMFLFTAPISRRLQPMRFSSSFP